MKKIHLENSWIIKAPLEKVFKIMTDFEKMPEYFPTVAESLVIISRDGNKLKIEATAKSFGTVFPVKMQTEIIPNKGFISDNQNTKLGVSGHEEFLMEEVEGGTKINYIYEVDIHKKLLRIIAKPLIGWYAMKFWEKAVINKLRDILEK